MAVSGHFHFKHITICEVYVYVQDIDTQRFDNYQYFKSFNEGFKTFRTGFRLFIFYYEKRRKTQSYLIHDFSQN